MSHVLLPSGQAGNIQYWLSYSCMYSVVGCANAGDVVHAGEAYHMLLLTPVTVTLGTQACRQHFDKACPSHEAAVSVIDKQLLLVELGKQSLIEASQSSVRVILLVPHVIIIINHFSHPGSLRGINCLSSRTTNSSAACHGSAASGVGGGHGSGGGTCRQVCKGHTTVYVNGQGRR